MVILSFPGGTSGKESACQYRKYKRHKFDPWVGKIPWRRNPCQYSCLENPTDRGLWWVQSMWLQRLGHNWASEHIIILEILSSEIAFPTLIPYAAAAASSHLSCPTLCDPTNHIILSNEQYIYINTLLGDLKLQFSHVQETVQHSAKRNWKRSSSQNNQTYSEL